MFEEEERGVAEEIQGTKLCAVTQSCLCLLKICLFVLSEPPAQPTHESHCVDVPLCSMQHRLNGPLNLLIFPVGSAPSMQSWIVIYGVVESNTPISCLGTGVQWDQLQMATVRVLQRWCASPSSSRQPVAVKSPPPLSSAVRGAEENKSIKAGALLLAPLERGGARPVKGEAPCVLDSIRQSVRPPLGAGCIEGGCRPV